MKFRASYGNFIDIKFLEMYKGSLEKELLFRYKALYERSNANKELRLTLNEGNKVSSLKIMEWVDVFLHK